MWNRGCTILGTESITVYISTIRCVSVIYDTTISSFDNYMTPQDLMIDDWVYNEHHKKNIRLTAYDFFTHGHDKMTDEQYLLPNSQPTTFRDKTPIPLTEEILKANGFVSEEDNKSYWKHCKYWDISFQVSSDYEGDMIITSELLHSHVVLGCVHELQHALRLVGLNELANNFKLPQHG